MSNASVQPQTTMQADNRKNNAAPYHPGSPKAKPTTTIRGIAVINLLFISNSLLLNML